MEYKMNVNKKIVSRLPLCYCIAPIQLAGKRYFAVASEKEYACLLFDEDGRMIDKIWDGPGGTMSISQIPGIDGAFLAIQKFYSPNNSKEAKLVMCRYNNGEWEVRTVAEMPYIHRFDILERDNEYYLLACCLKSNYEYKDDWRFPGRTYGCKLPNDLGSLWTCTLDFQLLKDSMLKNHGYFRYMKDNVEKGLVTCQNGVFLFTPPSSVDNCWDIKKIISDPTSDAVMIDMDSDGEDELLTLSPFHGDKLRIYHNTSSGYTLCFEYEHRIDFAHAICSGSICGKNRVIVGHRKGKRELLSVSYDRGNYHVEVLDSDVGPANVVHYKYKGKDILISANREISEIAYYELTD